MQPTLLEQALAAAIGAARDAGALLRDELHRPGGPRGAHGHAEVDVEAERAVRARLLAQVPWGYLGEETGRAQGAGGPYLWLVDPNDGTTDFLLGRRGSAVSIAALRDGLPVLGVVYAFAHPDDAGDLIAWAEGGPITRNGAPVRAALGQQPFGRLSVVLVSSAADRAWAANAACVAPARFRAMPSIAYRLALAAVGEADAAVSLNGPCHWDFAAGHALVLAAGGELVDERGQPVRYAEDGTAHVGHCFGGTADAVQALAAARWGQIGHATAPLAPVRPARRVADPGKLARAQGCLLGQLAGDALGQLVEFSSAHSIAARYPAGVRDMADGGFWNTLAGQPTDDSELALALARTLVKEGGFEAGAVLEAYAAWYRSGPFDIGGTTRAALGPAAAAQPAARLEAARRSARADSEANGSLMRVSPLGILGAGRELEAAGWAREDSALTHPSPVCQAACAAFVAAIAASVERGCGPRAAHEAALLAVKEERPGASEVRKTLLRAADAAPADFKEHEGWVLIALQNAFYQLLHAPSLEDALVDTVGRGGDTDTNGAIAGALLGAIAGREAVPLRWQRAVLSCRPIEAAGARNPRPIEYWPVDALELAEGLLVAGRALDDRDGEDGKA